MPTLESTVVTKTANSRTQLSQKSLLSISPNPEDHAALCRIVRDLAWHLSAAQTVREASAELMSEPYSVIVCEAVLGDGTWEDLLRLTGESPLIVTSRLADAHLWSEVLNLGGYDVLSKPFSRREVVHVLTTIALRFELRDAPVQLAAAG